jgi:segregation and condensation protein B
MNPDDQIPTDDATPPDEAMPADETPADESPSALDEAVDAEPSPEPGQPGLEHRRAVEAILMVADQPVETALLAELLELAPGRVDDLVEGLAESYRVEQRGFDIVRIAGGWRYQSANDLMGYVEKFALEGQVARLSAAALETLAIVAYRQPISRAQISLIRGVNVDGVMRTLGQRGYVSELGNDSGPGQAVLYGTTTKFLEGIGMDSLADLPPLGDFVPGPEIMEALEAGLGVDKSAAKSAGPEADLVLAQTVDAPSAQPSDADQAEGETEGEESSEGDAAL